VKKQIVCAASCLKERRMSTYSLLAKPTQHIHTLNSKLNTDNYLSHSMGMGQIIKSLASVSQSSFLRLQFLFRFHELLHSGSRPEK